MVSPESPQSPSGSEPIMEKRLGDIGIDESPVTPTPPPGPGNPLEVPNGERNSGNFGQRNAPHCTANTSKDIPPLKPATDLS